MARYHYVILSRSKPGQEEEYRRWYAEQHLPDVARQPGVVSAKLFAPDLQRVYEMDAPDYVLMTVYELETDDPVALVDRLRSMSGSEGMPSTDSIDKSGMVQMVGHLIATA